MNEQDCNLEAAPQAKPAGATGYGQICLNFRQLAKALQLPQSYHIRQASVERSHYFRDHLLILVESRDLPVNTEDEDGQIAPELELGWRTTASGKWRQLISITPLQSKHASHEQRLLDEIERLRESVRELVQARQKLFEKRGVEWRNEDLMDEIAFLRAQHLVESLPV